jgi:hypothetical protein
MALTLSNLGVVANAAHPFKAYTLVVTLDATATTGTLAHGCGEVPAFYTPVFGGSSTVQFTKVIATSGSAASTSIDVTVDGAGTNGQTVRLLAWCFNQSV